MDSDGDGVVCESLPDAPSSKTNVAVSNVDNPHLAFGNPSPGSQELTNYLIERPEYVLSYNCSRGTANWVSWNLNQSWLGSAEREDDFRPDPLLPSGCYAVRPSAYRRTGYDRGHLVPSGDRTSTAAVNSATFYMTNMIPQSPTNNRGVWRELEEYSRELVLQGKELYIVAGVKDSLSTIANSQVTVPALTWKVILVTDDGVINQNSYAIAVQIPNTEAVKNTDWQDYQTSVDTIENLTGYDFFSDVPLQMQERIESQVN